MIFDGKINLKANIQKTFDTVLKPEVLQAIVPGGESMVLTGPNAYEAVMKQKVGPFSAKVKIFANIVELNPPTHIKAALKGELLGGLGQFVGDMIVDFKDIGKDDLEVTYKVNANITGKIAVVGDRVMRVKAKSMQEEITKNLQEKLAG
jgi:carbon monoxide dehydrogenase subunit G